MGLGITCTSWACVMDRWDNKQCMPRGKPSISVRQSVIIIVIITFGFSTRHQNHPSVYLPSSLAQNIHVLSQQWYFPGWASKTRSFQQLPAWWSKHLRHWAKYTSNPLLCVARFILLAHLKPEGLAGSCLSPHTQFPRSHTHSTGQCALIKACMTPILKRRGNYAASLPNQHPCLRH